jgi:hypothetical protein
LNKFSVLYKGNDGEVIPVVAGFPFRGFDQKAGKKELHSIDDCNSIVYDKSLGYVAYAEPEHAENGIIFLGSLMPEGSDQALIGQGMCSTGVRPPSARNLCIIPEAAGAKVASAILKPGRPT